MSLLNGSAVKAREVLDFCMANESPELKAKVFEIISLSGLEPNDPMFMTLLLTGQIRVFLEATQEELSQLLNEWKKQSTNSLSEIYSAISQIKQTQLEQASAIKENLETVSQKCVSDIKEAGMSTVGAIAEANSETLEQVQNNKKQVEDLSAKLEELDAKLDERERKRIENANSVTKWANSTTQKQAKVNEQVAVLTSEIAKIQRNKVWLKIADVFWSIPALITFGLVLIGGTWWFTSRGYYKPTTVFARDILDWNLDRIVHCQKTDNPKCTVWIVHPNSPLRNK